ncbi:uncharacterized protein LOC143349571 [Colletes latitarsis]|uniref:uncharacterized protein LOC143349571 n=1 Tax=Colletes latitarsis TaxID=2605962 RepID=UPI004035E0F0
MTSLVARYRFCYNAYKRNGFFFYLKEESLVRCIDLEETELVHLSQKLNPLECLRLVKAVYDLTPLKLEHRASYKDSSDFSTTSNECLVNLEQWNNDFPRSKESDGRSAMEMTLRWLGRPDLAKYVRENDRSNNFEFTEHKVSRRHLGNDKHSPRKEKKKKKRGHVAANKRFSHKVHDLKKKESKSKANKDYLEQHRSICCSILFVLFFIVLCLVTAYFLRRRSDSKAHGARFKYNWSTNKQDKDTITDYLDEYVCSCSDVEGGCTGKCPTCSPSNQIPLDKYVNSVCVQKTKDRKRSKKQRFSFLQRSFHQDKKREKDQRNRDKKKTLEKSVKKRERYPSQGDYQQCVCCKCNLIFKASFIYVDKMSREKKENEKRELCKLKAKKRREKKEKELRRTEKYGNVCFTDTCK